MAKVKELCCWHTESKGDTVPRPACLPQETVQTRREAEIRPGATWVNDTDMEIKHSTSNKNVQSQYAIGTTPATQALSLQSQIHKRTPWKQQENNLIETSFQQGLPFTLPEETRIFSKPQAFPVQSAQAEVIRILQSHTAWEVLGVTRHAPSTSWRREYLHRSLMVHPDKCKYARAGEAFGRLTDAYKHLTEGGPWHASSASASSPGKNRSSSNFHAQQHQRNYPFAEPAWKAGDDGGNPFDFFRDAAEQAFRAGEFSREEFSDVLGQPAAVGGALVGAVLGGGLGSILGAALGSRAGGAVALEGSRCLFCGGGRCERCRARESLGTSVGGAAGTTAGLALGATAGAAIGARLGSAIASALDADSERRRGREHASTHPAADAERTAQSEAQFERDCKQQ